MCHFLAKLLGEDCLFFNVIIYFCVVKSINSNNETYD